MKSRPVTAGQKSKISRKQEEAAAKRFGGTRQPGSGNKWYAPGDVRVEGLFLMEAKYTDSPSFSLTRSVIEKIAQEAYNAGQDYWVVEVWFRKNRSKLYAVDINLLRAAQQNGLVVDNWQGRILDKTKSVRLGFRDKGVTVCNGWNLEFAIIEESLMAQVTQTVQEGTFLDIGTILHYYLRSMNQKNRTRALGVIGPSSLHYCKRRGWYRLMAVEPAPRVEASLRMIFQIGHAVHDMVQGWITEIFGPEFFTPEVRATMPEYYLSGSCDGVFHLPDDQTAMPTLPDWASLEVMHFVDRVIDALMDGKKLGLEIKTCSTTPSTPKPEHMEQAVTYGKALGLTHMCFLYINKRNGEVMSFIRSVDNHIVWKNVVAKLKSLKEYTDAGKEPPRELSRDCAGCEYQFICKPPGY